MFIPLHDTNKLKHIKLQYVTLGILAVNILIWVFMATPAFVGTGTVQAAITSFGYIPAVANGYLVEPIGGQSLPTVMTYFSYSFFHGDFMHLAGNMLFIWVFGDNVEDAMGHGRYFIFYLACAAAGAYAHGLMTPQSQAPLIGASGAVAGVIGAYLLLHPRVKVWVLAMGRIPLKVPAMYVLGFWIAFQFYQLFASPDSAVSFAAHIGGALAGIVLIFFFKRSDIVLFDRDIPASIGRSKGAVPVDDRLTDFDQNEGLTRHRPQATKAETKSSSKRTSVPSFGKKGKPSIWGR